MPKIKAKAFEGLEVMEVDSFKARKLTLGGR